MNTFPLCQNTHGMRLMNSKERPYNLNELVGEAAFDVLLTDQPVTTASIILALRARMLKN
jgi:hypothetical protein